MTTADQLAIVNKLLQQPEEAHTLAQVSPSLTIRLITPITLKSQISLSILEIQEKFYKVVSYPYLCKTFLYIFKEA